MPTQARGRGGSGNVGNTGNMCPRGGACLRDARSSPRCSSPAARHRSVDTLAADPLATATASHEQTSQLESADIPLRFVRAMDLVLLPCVPLCCFVNDGGDDGGG